MKTTADLTSIPKSTGRRVTTPYAVIAAPLNTLIPAVGPADRTGPARDLLGAPTDPTLNLNSAEAPQVTWHLPSTLCVQSSVFRHLRRYGARKCGHVERVVFRGVRR